MARKLGNWLAAYREYTAGTESPTSFHLWAGIGALAAAAQRKVFAQVGRLTFHSNFLIVLTGPSGGPKKSTAIEFARDLLIDLEDYGITINLSPQKSTGAALISRLCNIDNKEHQSLTAFIMELGTLLGSHDVDMSDTLTALWDCSRKWEKDTVARGNEAASKPWLHILSATTPTWLAENVSSTALEGGLISRAIFVYEEKPERRIAVPSFTTEQEQLGRYLKHDLAAIAKLSGALRMDPETLAFYTDWYENHPEFFRAKEERLQSFYTRKHVHTIKTASIMSLARGDSLVITMQDFMNAIAAVEAVEQDMRLAFQGIGKNIHSMDYERIKRFIEIEGSVWYKSIIGAYIHAIPREAINGILEALLDAEEVGREGQRFFSKNGKH